MQPIAELLAAVVQRELDQHGKHASDLTLIVELFDDVLVERDVPVLEDAFQREGVGFGSVYAARMLPIERRYGLIRFL
jgi:hypothetical protein